MATVPCSNPSRCRVQTHQAGSTAARNCGTSQTRPVLATDHGDRDWVDIAGRAIAAVVNAVRSMITWVRREMAPHKEPTAPSSAEFHQERMRLVGMYVGQKMSPAAADQRAQAEIIRRRDKVIAQHERWRTHRAPNAAPMQPTVLNWEYLRNQPVPPQEPQS